jgi:hypothetical protein
VKTVLKLETRTLGASGDFAVRTGALCVCGVRLEGTDDLSDHLDWCLGNERANAQLRQEVIRRHGEITYETLFAGSHHRFPPWIPSLARTV